MGEVEKASRSKMCKPRNVLGRHKDVTDPVISELLKDFTSAELFPQTGNPHHSNIHETKSDCTCNDVILSLKNLHVRRPDFKKHRRSKKVSQLPRGSANLLNLAMAASNLQRPVLWPARLTCDCKKSSVSMLIPSKLKIHKKSIPCSTKNKFSTNSDNLKIGETCFLCNSRNDKGHLTNKQQPLQYSFGHSLNVSSPSFKSLCLQQNSGNLLTTGANICKSKKENLARSKLDVFNSLKTTTNKQQHLFPGKQLFTNLPLEPISFSDAFCSSGDQTDNLPSTTSTTGTAIYAKPSTQASFATTVPETSYSSASQITHSFASTTQHSSSSAGPGRSCSQEMRDVEDTNVNELASYLEDLLHIPRKMSKMAEMMYA